MDKWLSPREVAEILGINPDTLRRWERDGLIESERTPGGQRRYREEDALALLDGDKPTRETNSRERSAAPLPAIHQEVEVEQPRQSAMPSWERRVKEEAADVEVIKLRREKAALVRAEHEEREERQRQELFRKQELARRTGEAERKEKAEAADRQRLANLRVYGNASAIGAPPEYQARVARDLLSSVNAEEYPADLSLYLAYNQVSSRVSHLLKPWRESQEREREEEEEKRQLNILILGALSYARTETREWEPKDAARALREVEEELRREAEADWTMDDVRDLVAEVLDEWEYE